MGRKRKQGEWRMGEIMSSKLMVVLLYYYRIVGNFHWCKISQKCVQTLQKKFSHFFYFAEASLSVKITKICTQQIFPTVRYITGRQISHKPQILLH